MPDFAASLQEGLVYVEGIRSAADQQLNDNRSTSMLSVIAYENSVKNPADRSSFFQLLFPAVPYFRLKGNTSAYWD